MKRGKILTFIVDERPRMRIVEYRGLQRAEKRRYRDEAEEEEAQISVDSFYDPPGLSKWKKSFGRCWLTRAEPRET